MDIAAWLRALGLEEYAEAFRKNAIDADVLLELTADDLKDLGVGPVGHRRKLLNAIGSLQDRSAPPATQVAAGDAILPATATRGAGQSSSPYEPTWVERRQLTVMFCDLVGSTALATRLDPEELRDVVAVYHTWVADTVRRFNGFVAKYMGDGVLIYFGYPQAHEDDAERAVRAGLALLGTLGTLEVAAGPLQIRIGIATGTVVVGDLVGLGEAQERGIVGETPNLAARLQGLAEPGALLIDMRTQQLTRGLFEYGPVRAVSLKGFAQSVEVFSVLQESATANRFDALHSRIGPMVGRDEEIALVLRRWAHVLSGTGRVVLISGEPGIGKSRLVAALEENLGIPPNARISYFCSAHHSTSPLYPVIVHLERSAGFRREDTVESRRGKMEQLLDQTHASREQRALVADLLSLTTGGHDQAEVSSPKRKERILTTLMHLIQTTTQNAPILMVWEDVHWIDPTSRELLDLLVSRVQNLPILIVITFRPEFAAPWVGQAGVTALTLSRLEPHQAAPLVEQWAGGRTLPDELIEQIILRTDGVPLFVEELTKAIVESGVIREQGGRYVVAEPAQSLVIPATLQASLMARLDRVPSARELAQIGAAVGREFPYELVAAVAQQPKHQVEEALQALVNSELIFIRGVPPDAVCTFKHALVQETAYGTLLKSKRRELHHRIVDALESRFPQTIEREPEIVAEHCARAGLISRAVELWLKAGRRAAQRSASPEAISHFMKALSALQGLPDGIDRQERELEIQFSLGPVLLATKGWTDPEAARVYERARILAGQLGRGRERFNALWGLRYIYTAHGETREGLELLDEMLRTADQLGDSECRLQAHHAAWASLSWLGDLERACQHIDAGLKLYNPEKHSGQALTYGGHDPGVCARGHGSLPVWLLGYPDRALRSAQEGVELAQTLEHKPSVAHGLLWAATCHQLRREGSAALECSTRLFAVAEEHGLALYSASALAIRGWALAEQNAPADGLAEMRRGLDAYRATDVKAMLSYHTTMLAQVYLCAGSPDRASDTLADALQIAEKAGEGFWRSEILRLQGEVALILKAREAESLFLEALAVAESQRAKSLQLRAALALARSRVSRGQHQLAYELLTPIYSWFTEGCDTADLLDARALLKALSTGTSRGA